MDEHATTIDFELFAVRTAANRRARRHGAPAALAKMRCTACGDEATMRDPRMAQPAAKIHASTAHGGAAARVRSVPPVDA